MSGRKPATPVMTEEEVGQIRIEVRALMDGTEGLTLAQLGREIGVSDGTLGPWLTAIYKGRNDLVAERVRKGLATRKEGQVTRQRAGSTRKVYVETAVSKSVIDALTFAQSMPDFAIVVGASGIGKSAGACEYTATRANVWKITCRPSICGPKAVLDELARIMGVIERSQLHRVSHAVMNKVRDRQALIIVDEAHFLEAPAIEELRAIHDTGCGIALIGNPTITSQLEGNLKIGRNGQLTSRAGLRVKLDKAKKGDAEAILDCWNVEDDRLRTALLAAGTRPGSHRVMEKVWVMAQLFAGGRDNVALEHIERADRMMMQDGGRAA